MSLLALLSVLPHSALPYAVAGPAPQVGELEIHNTGIALLTFEDLLLDDGRLAFRLTEYGAFADGTDFNGDGDTSDRVVHLLDVATGALQNTGLAGRPLPIDGNLLPVEQDEAQAGADLNGDGDLDDNRVLAIFNLETGLATNLGLATGPLFGGSTFETNLETGGKTGALVVVEDRQDADLNGDGDLDDTVLHAVDLETGTITNLGFAVQAFEVSRDGIAFPVRELGQGTDINGDGDQSDNVLHLFSEATWTTIPTDRAILFNSLLARDDGSFLSVLREQDNGGVDLNGDGDGFDRVLHSHSITGPLTSSLGFAVGPYSAAGELLAFAVSEQEQGGADLNGDGDAFDQVVFVQDGSGNAPLNLGLANFFFPPLEVVGQRVRIAVPEADQFGADLNGDSDAQDACLHLWEATSGAITLLPYAAGAARSDGSRLVFEISETSQGSDLNGNDKFFDRLIGSYDLATGAFSITDNNGTDPLLDGGLALALGDELADQYTDANGDGDGIDDYPLAIDPGTGAVIQLPLAVEFNPTELPAAIDGDLVAVLVNESRQGADLNGDGLLSGDILHTVRLPFAAGLSSSTDALSIADGGSQSLRFEGGIEHANQGYLILGSATGSSPGFEVNGTPVPLVFDAYTQFSLTAPGFLPFTNSFGVLDDLGGTVAPSIDLPPGLDPALAGTLLFHSLAVLDLNFFAATIDASNATALALIP